MNKKALFALLVAITSIANAQILNSSFENLNSSGTIKNWGNFFIWSVTLDTNGVGVADSIVFDNKLYFSTNDAHTGSKALEMRNAFNYTSNQSIAGSARLTPNDTDYAAFTQMIDIQQQPSHLSFFYKFFPAGADTAYAYMNVFDSLGNDIGFAEAEINIATSIYKWISKPIVYTSQESAAFISIGFRTAKPGSAANFGTRFLVDDVNLLITSIGKQNNDKVYLSCFPNPARDFINITLDISLQKQHGIIEILDMTGKIVKKVNCKAGENIIRVETTDLQSGTYAINYITANKRYRSTFIK